MKFEDNLSALKEDVFSSDEFRYLLLNSHLFSPEVEVEFFSRKHHETYYHFMPRFKEQTLFSEGLDDLKLDLDSVMQNAFLRSANRSKVKIFQTQNKPFLSDFKQLKSCFLF